MLKKFTGPFVIITKQECVFGASAIEVDATNINIYLEMEMQTFVQHLKQEDISIIYEVNPRHPVTHINPAILSTLASLEKMLVEFTRGKAFQPITIFGARSLALTLLPHRTTNDLNILATDAFAAFVNRKNPETDLEVEILDETLLRFLGPWKTRTVKLSGPLGYPFQMVHPLDTVMQKLLRHSPTRFEEKDQGDIRLV